VEVVEVEAEVVEVEAEVAAVGGITSKCMEVGDAEGVVAGKIAEILEAMLAKVDQLRMLQCTRPMFPKSTLSLSATTR
jgi:hypothetical protein